MIAGLASSLPHTLTAGLRRPGGRLRAAIRRTRRIPAAGLVPVRVRAGREPGAHPAASSPPVPFSTLSPARVRVLTGHEFFPQVISGPFHDGLVIVFATAAVLVRDRRHRLARPRQAHRPAVDRRDTPAELHPPAQSRAGLA